MASATVSIHLEAQTATLKKGFDEAKQAIHSLDANMGMSVAKGMAMFNVGLGAVKAALGAVQGAIASVMNAFDEMGKMQDFAERLGMSSDALTVLGFAAEQTGASQDSLNNSLQKMQNALAEAAQGTGSGEKAFRELGLSIADLQAMKPDAQFAAIADALTGVGSVSDRTRLVLDIFGKSGGELTNMLAGGSAGLNAFGTEAERMGLLLGQGREGVESAGDSIDKMKRAWGGFVQQIAVLVAPALTMIAEGLATIVGWFNRLIGSATGAEGTFKKFAAVKTTVSIADPAAEAAKKKADAEAEAARKKIEDRGKAVTESLRTPMQIYRDTVAELNTLVNAGTISWDTYNAGVKKAVESLSGAHKAAKDFTTPGIGAVTRNSTEGFSAVQAAKRQRDDSERRHRESITTLLKIVSAIYASSIEIAPVRL